MDLAVKRRVLKDVESNKEEVRRLVLAGLEQVKQGKVKDFDAVCDRLEKKYRDIILQDRNY